MPITQKLKCYLDLKSPYRSIWFTGYILITWYYEDFWKTLNVTFYKSGEYE
jgi:hypothetical protein